MDSIKKAIMGIGVALYSLGIGCSPISDQEIKKHVEYGMKTEIADAIGICDNSLDLCEQVLNLHYLDFSNVEPTIGNLDKCNAELDDCKRTIDRIIEYNR